MSPGALPGLLRPPFAVVGGATLLPEFFSRAVALSEMGSILWICSPYVDAGVVKSIPEVAALPHALVALRVIASDERNAESAWLALSAFPWHSCDVGIRAHLHAKIYLL